MPTVHFYGKVLPSSTHLTIIPIPDIKTDILPLGLQMTFTINIQDCSIDMVCEINKLPMEHFASIHARALDMCRGAIDIFSFSTGVGLTTILEYFVHEDGSQSPILGNHEYLKPLCTAYSLNDGITSAQIREFVLKNHELYMALNDLIMAITIPQDLRMNCGRALDGIRRLIGGADAEKAWPKVQTALRADRAYLKFITDNARGQRHGEHRNLQGEMAVELLTRSWILMNRYFEYLKRKQQPLPETEFPLLKG